MNVHLLKTLLAPPSEISRGKLSPGGRGAAVQQSLEAQQVDSSAAHRLRRVPMHMRLALGSVQGFPRGAVAW